MSFQLQPATQADLPAIVAIYNSTVASHAVTADLEPVTVADRQSWFDAHKDNRPLYVVKDTHGQVLGWGSLSDYYAREAYNITAEISIYLHEDARGKGLGKWLLNAMMERAPVLGIRNMIAVIFGHNQASLRLFRHAGFEQWGLLPQVCDFGDKLADIVLLGKRL